MLALFEERKLAAPSNSLVLYTQCFVEMVTSGLM